MPVVIVRPDNFIDPLDRRILTCADREDLLERAVQAYRLALPSHAEAQLWTHPQGYTCRRQLFAEESVQDGMTLYLRIHVHITRDRDAPAPGDDEAAP